MKRLIVWAVGLTLASTFIILKIPGANTQFQNSFLIWNLFLAALPLVFAYLFEVLPRPIHWLALPVWLVFLPNSFYILTDVGHILNIYRHSPEIGRQFLVLNGDNLGDVLSWQGLKFLCLAGAGWCYGVLSVVMIWRRLELSRWRLTLFEITICFLSGVGVALGRFYRWNTWDLLYDFDGISRDLREVFTTTTGQATILVFAVLIFCTLRLGQEIKPRT